MNRTAVAKELVAIARLLEQCECEDCGQALSAGLKEEAAALALKGKVKDYLDEVKKFRGQTNAFVDAMTKAVRNPKSLAAFPPLRDIISLNAQLRQSVLPHTFLHEADIANMLQTVICKDTGAC